MVLSRPTYPSHMVVWPTYPSHMVERPTCPSHMVVWPTYASHSGVAHLPLTHGRSLWQSLHGYIGGCHVVGALGFGGLVGTGNIRLGFVSFKLWTCCGLSLSGCGLIGSEFFVVMVYLRTLVNVVWGAGWGLGCRDIFVV